MQTKKYEAPTIQEALDTIKRELGPEAIILQTRQNRRGFGLLSKTSVEVTAAVSEKALEKKVALEKRLPEYAKETVPKLSATKQAKVYDAYAESLVQQAQKKSQDRVEISRRKITSTPYVDIDRPQESPTQRVTTQTIPQPQGQDLSSEIERLKAMVRDLQVTTKQNADFPEAAQQSAFELLVAQGTDRYLAQTIVKEAIRGLKHSELHDSERVLDEVAVRISERVRLSPFIEGMIPGEGRKMVAFVGPTGVGKTTTIAKLASHAILNRNLKVALINLDQFKVGASEQLSHYAQILRIPFRSVSSRAELEMVLKEFQNFDLVLIDTAGRSQKDETSLRETQELLAGLPDLRTHLVLSVATRELELIEMGRRFLRFHPETLIASKLDEVGAHGVIFNMTEKLDLPLSYFTTGQRVPEDLEPATMERVVALVMDL